MSTEGIILSLEAAGTLVRVEPRFRGPEREVRRMSLLKEPIHDWTVSPGKHQDLRSATRTHFATFVKGEPVDDRDFMKRVSRKQPDGTDNFDDGVWSLRPVAQPKYRFFGMFACPDWVIVFNKQSRDQLAKHPNNWHKEMGKSLRVWGDLFGGRPCWLGTRFSHYVQFRSEHADGRWTES